MTDSPKSKRRPWWRSILLLALAYATICGIMMFFEDKLIFRASSAEAYWREPPSPRVQDVYLESAGGVRIHAWWYPTSNWKPEHGALLYCHGNAGNISSRAPGIASWQEALGLGILIFDYPGYGKSGGKPTEQGCYDAGTAAYQWLVQEKKVPADRIVLYGGSLGGGVATELASCNDHRALVLVKTFTSLPDAAADVYFWLPARLLVRTRFNNLAKITACKKPVFVAHGTLDSLIPFAHGKRLFDAANEPKAFLAMEGADHNDRVPPDFFERLNAFLVEHAP